MSAQTNTPTEVYSFKRDPAALTKDCFDETANKERCHSKLKCSCVNVALQRPAVIVYY